MLGLIFGQSKKTNLDKAPQDVAAAPAPVGGQEQGPEIEPDGKETEEDDLQEENELEEKELDGKLPAATTASSVCMYALILYFTG